MRLFTDVRCDTEPQVVNHWHKKAVEAAAELEMTVEVTSDQSEGQGCSLKVGIWLHWSDEKHGLDSQLVDQDRGSGWQVAGYDFATFFIEKKRQM